MIQELSHCENLCEKNFPNPAKIGTNQKKCATHNLINSIAYNNLRRLGNSGDFTLNQ